MPSRFKPITTRLYKAWLRSRLDNYTRSLHAIAAQRENDFQAERLLHRAVSETRSNLSSSRKLCKKSFPKLLPTRKRKFKLLRLLRLNP